MSSFTKIKTIVYTFKQRNSELMEAVSRTFPMHLKLHLSWRKSHVSFWLSLYSLNSYAQFLTSFKHRLLRLVRVNHILFLLTLN